MAKPNFSTGSVSFMRGYKPGDPIDKEKIKDELRRYLPLYYLQMIPTQEKFIRIKNANGRTPKTRLFEGANQCLTASTLIETPGSEVSVGEMFRRGKPFEVWAWNGRERVAARALAPFSKGLAQCYRVTLADGRWIEGSADHLVLCGDSSYVPISSLHQVFEDLQESTSDSGLPVHASGAVRLTQTQSDFLDRCSTDPSQCGGRLLPGEDISRVFSPSPVGARQHSAYPCQGTDDFRTTHTSTPWTSFFRPSSLDGLDRLLDRCVESSSQAAYRASEWLKSKLLFRQLLSTAEGIQLQSCVGFSLDRLRSDSGASSSGNPPDCVNQIVSILPITCQEVFDFCVPEYHNYYAASIVNHNSGKSQIGVADDIAHAMGFRPWLPKGDPDYRIPIQVPNTGLVGCEVAGQTLAQNIEPRFMKFIPLHCGAEKTRYSDGSIKSLYLPYDFNGDPCGSTIHFRSYVQPAESFEGIIAHWIHWDEPPPRAILNAAERGKMSTNAPSWLTMTPLKEPYIYDIFSLQAFNNGGQDQEIAVFRCSVWENCQDWCRDCDVAIPENQPENLKPDSIRPVDKCTSCGRTMGFMPRAGIDNYLRKITDPDEREAREEGKWKHLSGLVYKQLDRAVHLYPDFEIPAHWMRIEVVDPHDAKPTRWLFGAVSPEEISIGDKVANRIYWYSYLLLQGTIHELARQVRVRRAQQGYREPGMVILDAKYGARTVKTQLDETSWEDELEKAGIRGIVLSHSAPGDVALGHKAVKEYLQPQFSTLQGKEIPGMLFAAEGCGGDRGPIQDFFNYSWMPGTDKPQEGYKDFADCGRYAALEQPTYRQPEPDIDPAIIKSLLDQRKEAAYNPNSYGLVFRR